MTHIPRRLTLSGRTGSVLALLAVLACPAWRAQAAPPPLSSHTAIAALAAAQSANTFPPADEVFHFKAVPGAHRVRLQWTIRPGYYLYRGRIHVAPLSGTRIGALSLPPGRIKVDPYFGREQIYRRAVTAELTVTRGTNAAPQVASFAVTYQGCADRGLCYPPITKDALVRLPPGPRCPANCGSPRSPAPEACLRCWARSTSRGWRLHSRRAAYR